MRLRTAAAMAALTGSIVLSGAPPAHAFSVVNYDWWDFYGYGCLSGTCWVSWVSMSIQSLPQYGDCTSGQGGYSACRFRLNCQTEGWGLRDYVLDCADYPQRVCLGEDQVPVEDCRHESYGSFVIARDTCRDVAVTATARSLAEAMPVSHQVRLCVDRDGPYTEPLVNYQPVSRIELP